MGPFRGWPIGPFIEMGYNDTEAPESKAKQKMRKQPWFLKLRDSTQHVKLVIFVAQPSYKQCAGSRKGKRGKSHWTPGDVVPAAPLAEAAASLVRTELGLATHILRADPEELYAGFCRDADGALWQDESTCRSYTDHGIIYAQACN